MGDTSTDYLSYQADGIFYKGTNAGKQAQYGGLAFIQIVLLGAKYPANALLSYYRYKNKDNLEQINFENVHSQILRPLTTAFNRADKLRLRLRGGRLLSHPPEQF